MEAMRKQKQHGISPVPNGTFADGKLLTKEERLERDRRTQAGREKPAICEIPGCGRSDQIHFDHDHTSKKFRGWICQGCNKALGYVKDNPERLRQLAAYLERALAAKGD